MTSLAIFFVAIVVPLQVGEIFCVGDSRVRVCSMTAEPTAEGQFKVLTGGKALYQRAARKERKRQRKLQGKADSDSDSDEEELSTSRPRRRRRCSCCPRR